MPHPAQLVAQCVMCFRTAAAQQSGRAQVLNTGIIILLLVPLVVLIALVLLVRRREAARRTSR